MFHTTFSSILPSFLVIFVGYLVGKVFSPDPVGLAGRVAAWVMVPVVTFTFLNEYTPSFTQLRDFGLGVAVIFLFFYFFSRLFKEKRDIVLVSSVAANVGYLGYPILLALWGEKALALGVVYAALNIIMFSTVLPVFLGEKASFKNLFSLPYIYALSAGFLTGRLGWSYKELPPFLLNAITMLRSSAIPYLLLYVGLSMSKVKFEKGVTKFGFLVTVSKLILAPAVALLFALLYGLEGVVGKVFVLETAMPVAINTVVIVSALRGDAETVGFGVAITTFFAMFTLPLWVIILELIFA